MIWNRHFPDWNEIWWLPIIVAVQFVFSLGLALMLSALTVHFRDIRDLLSNLLTFWFFATPIIYPYFMESVSRLPVALQVQSVLSPGGVVPGSPLLSRAVRPSHVAAVSGGRVGALLLRRLLGVRSPARLLCGGGMTGTDGDRARDVTKIYRRYGGRHFATLKSALLQRSILSDLRPTRDLSGAAERLVQRAEGIDLRRHRPERIRQEHGAQARGRHHEALERHGKRARAASRRSSSSAPGFIRKSPAAKTSSSTASCWA